MKNSKSEYNVDEDGPATATGGSIPSSKTTNGLSNKQHETIKEEGGKN
jgi:hypothetical protein